MIKYLLIALLGIFIYSFIEYRWLKNIYLKPIDFDTKHKIPDELKGKRIVFISDLQFDHKRRPFLHGAARNLVRRVNALKPDLVLLGGDYIHQEGKQNTPIFEYINSINAPKVAVLGNHDYREYEKSVTMLQDIGVTVLINEIYNYHGLDIIGVDDAIKSVPVFPIHEDKLSILLTHNPDYFEKLPKSTYVDMALAGHLHAGQVTLFGLYAPITNSEFDQTLVHGMIRRPQGSMYVSSGVGGTVGMLPIRFFARPEIVILDF